MLNLEKKHSNLEFAWIVLRLPLLLVIAFFLRHQVLEAALGILGIGKATLLAIDVISTPVTRLLFLCSMAAVILICAVFTRHLNLSTAYLIICIVGFTLIVAAIQLTGKSKIYAVPGFLLLVTNLLPANMRSKFPLGFQRLLLIIGIGLSELFFFWRHIRCAAWLARGEPLPNGASRWMWALPGALLASAVTAVFIGGEKLVPIEQTIRSPATVRRVAQGDFNWIKSDKAHRFLFGVGHGLNHVRMFDLSDWSKAPVDSESTIGWTQSFEYSPSKNELYVYDDDANKLLYFDAGTLALKRSVDIGKVAPGDTWIAADDRTNTITVASEADEEVGYPFVVVDRTTGSIVDHMNEEAGNLTLDPDSSLEYLSFFRRQSQVSIYDLQKKSIVRTAPIGPHAERMALWKAKNEVLVTLPLDSKIARVDAATLELKGHISAEFGVRAIAMDTRENLLFNGSIATGKLEIIDLTTMKRQKSYYLGPWLRTIEVIPDLGIAYVSSNGAIYEVRYR